MALVEFYEKWLATHLGLTGYYVEIAHSGPDNRGFTRNLLLPPRVAAEMIASLRRERNVMASTARYPEPQADRAGAVYPVLTLDFDCESSPRAALEAARQLKARLESETGAEAVLVKTGFKGAHLHIPLKTPATHSEVILLHEALSRLAGDPLCGEKRMLDPTTATDWRHLVRVPYTFNLKRGEKRLAVILDARLDLVRPREFEWGEPLDPRSLGIAVVDLEAPVIVRLGRTHRRYRLEWIERVLEAGLPDGRKRFILYAASRYLVNTRGLSEDETLEALRGFLEASCRNHGNCGRVYDSWLRSVIRGVRAKGLRPPSLEHIRLRDPELYELIQGMITSAKG